MNLLSTLPDELKWLIMKFAMSPQPKQLLEDIQTFPATLAEIRDLYKTHNDCSKTLLHDIYYVLNGFLDIHAFGPLQHLTSVMARNPRIHLRCDLTLYIFRRLTETQTSSQINMMWGLMNWEDRNHFYYYVTQKRYRINQKRVYILFEGNAVSCWSRLTDTLGDIGRKIQMHFNESRPVNLVAGASATPETQLQSVWYEDLVLKYAVA